MGRVVERLALPLIVVAATVLGAAYSLRVDEWRVMTDELLYLRMAENMGQSLSPLPEVHGVRLHVYSSLYSLLIAPLTRAFDLPTAVHVAHGLNALLMASAAVPAYLLGRWLAPGSRLAASAVAALTVFVPWLTFSFSLMTEAVAYPMVIWAVYGMVRAVAEPSPKADLLALVALLGAFLARTQFLFLFAVFPIAVVAHELAFRRSLRGAISRHPLLWAAVALGLVALAVGVDVYGSYRSVVDQQTLWPPGMGQALLDHVNEIAIGIGIVPLALTLAVTGHALVRPRANARVHALAIVTLLVAPAIAVIAASFDLNFGGRFPQERYVFYLVPLLFVGAAACLAVHRPPFAVTVGAGALTALAILQTTYYYPVFPAFASPTKFAYVPLDFRADQVGRLLGFADVEVASAAALAGFAAVVAVALASARGHASAALGVLACGLSAWGVALFLYCAPPVLAEHEALAQGPLGKDRPESARTWIDRIAGESASVGLVPATVNARSGTPIVDGGLDQAVWWDPEFWNKSVDRTFVLDPAQGYTPFPAVDLRIDPRSGRLVSSSGTLPGRLVLATSDVRFAPVSSSRVASPDGTLSLYRLSQPARAAWSTDVPAVNGTFPPATGARLTLYPSGRASLRKLSLLLERGTDDGGGYRITGPGVRRRGRLARYGTVNFEACVPARRRWVGRIDLPGAQTGRVASVTAAAGGECGGRARR